MAYRITRWQFPGADAARAAAEQLRRALACLILAPATPDAVHAARKHCKKARAALRLIATARADGFAPERALIRDAARCLAAARDAQAVLAVAEQRYAGPETEPMIAALRLRADQEAERADAGEAVDRAREMLRDATARIELAYADPGIEAVRAGWRSSRRRARKALRRARAQPTDDAYHTLRKRLKELWYHARLLHKAAPKRMGRIARLARKATDLLGDHHDLAVFGQALAELREVPAGMRGRVRADRAKLAHRALRASARAVKRSGGAGRRVSAMAQA